MDDSKFDGPRFRALRVAAGIPLVDIVTAAGRVTYRHVQQAEKDRRDISIELAHRLCRAYTELSGRPLTVDDVSIVKPAKPVQGEAA